MFEVLSRRFRRGVKARSEDGGALTVADVHGESPVDGELEGSAASLDGTEGEWDDESSDESSKTAWDLPDLFVVDGGRGQLGVALTAARDLGITDMPIIGLAKEKESPTGEKLVDRVYLPGQKNAIALRLGSPELQILALARDEAHRFSNRGREKLGKARRLRSSLDDVPGIGPKTRKALLSAFPNLEEIRRATDEALLEVTGVTRRHVKALRELWADPDGEIVEAGAEAIGDSMDSEGKPAVAEGEPGVADRVAEDAAEGRRPAPDEG
jgi:excinuclease ABC subunit C